MQDGRLQREASLAAMRATTYNYASQYIRLYLRRRSEVVAVVYSRGLLRRFPSY